jgi:hypothetical protein
VIFVETNSCGTSISLLCSTVYRGVCGNYSGVVHLPVKMCERVKYGNVYRFNSYCYEWCLSTAYILVCLLAGTGVMPRGDVTPQRYTVIPGLTSDPANEFFG